MPDPEAPPRLPILPFVVGDILLVALAVGVYRLHPDPSAPLPLVTIIACGILAPLLLVTPFTLNYIQEQARTDARRRAEDDTRSATLDRLVNLLGEQTETLAIATSTLQSLSTHGPSGSRHDLGSIEARLTELQQLIEQRATDDGEALEQEVATLRAAQLEKLTAAVEQLHRLSEAFTHAEHALTRRVAAAETALASLPAAATAATTELKAHIAAAATEAGQAAVTELSERLDLVAERAGAVAVRDLANAATPVTERIAHATEALMRAASILESATENLSDTAKRTGNIAAAVARASANPFPLTIEEPPPVAPHRIEPVAPQTIEPFEMREARLEAQRLRESAISTPPAFLVEPVVPLTNPPTPLHPEAPAGDPGAEADVAPASPESPSPGSPENVQTDDNPAREGGEPPAPTTSEFTSTETESPSATTQPGGADDDAKSASEATREEASTTTPPPKPPRTRRRSLQETSPELDLGLPPPPEPEVQPPVVTPTADGVTRLVATAYIGIGNRLFLRGDGPGLNPERGVPLQFVSIGKWRWEASEPAAFPFTITLWKNDTEPCESPSEVTVLPGHQVEVRTQF